MLMPRLLALLAVPLILLAACGESGRTGPPIDPGWSASTSTTPAGPLVTVQRTGGLAGVRDTVTVDGAGTWRATRRDGRTTSGRLDPSALTTLRTLIEQASWPVEATTGPRHPCPDGFIYHITAGNRVARTDDCRIGSQPDIAGLTAAVLGGAGL
jgi:hypothetical protein